MTFKKLHLCTHDKLKGSSNNFFQPQLCHSSLLGSHQQNNNSSEKYCSYLSIYCSYISIPVLTEDVIVEGLSGPVSNWFRKGISSSASLLKLRAVQVKHSVLIFQFIHSVLERNIQYWSLFTWNFQFEEYEMSKCGDMGKSLPYALRYVLLPVQCYFWWYSKICQIWRVIFSATLQKLLHFETKS